MAKIVDIHNFTAGMDLDSEARILASEASRLQRNTRYDDSLNSNAGATTNLMGNTLLDEYPFVPTTGDIVIGSCFDEKRDSVIYFVCNPDGEHSIVNYNIYTEEFFVLLHKSNSDSYWVNSGLNFNTTNKVTDAEVIGDTLYFRDNLRPRRFNLLRSMASSSPYPYIDDAVIDAIKHPPLAEPNVSLRTNLDVFINNLRGSSFQFRYRYIYDDFGYSVCGPISKPVIPRSGYSYNGEELNSEPRNNYCRISFDTGGCSVMAIEILARRGNAGDWFLAKSLNKELLSIGDNERFYWDFYNNSVISAVDQNDINRPYDYIPKEANSQVFLDNKYLGYGGCLDGFDNIDVNGRLWVTRDILPVGVGSSSVYNFATDDYVAILYYPPSLILVRKYQILAIDEGILAGLTNDFIMSVQIDFTTYSYDGNDIVDFVSMSKDYAIDTSGNAANVAALRQALLGYINTDFSSVAMGVTFALVPAPDGSTVPAPGFPLVDNEIGVLPTNFYLLDPFTPSTVIYVRFSNSVTGTSGVIYGGAKTGSSHKFALAYSDDSGKISTAQTSDWLEVYVPSIPETTWKMVGTGSNNFRSLINWELLHDPPEWATKYHWLYAGRRDMGAFKQYVIGGNSESPAVYNADADDSFTYISLAVLNNLTYKGSINELNPEEDPTKNTFVDFPIPNSLLEPYIFAKGDRIRFLTAPGSSEGDGYPLSDRVYPFLDMEILGYAQDVDGDDTNVIRVQRFSPDTAQLNRGTLVEIYTPKSNYSDEIYYEIGETYDIVERDGVKKHMGQNGDTDTPSGTFDIVDVVHTMRAMPYKLNENDTPGERMFWVESDNFCDFFESPVFPNGRINLFDITAEEKFLNIVRRSNPYFAETKTNGLGSFEYDKYLPVGTEHGDITRLMQVGYTLKILQERKITSVYIGKNGLRQAGADGAQVVVATDNVFNTTNPSELPYGTSDPESVVVRERQMFFFDRNSKCIVRDSANGPIDISTEYKISSLVRPLADSIAKYGGYVVSGVNNKYGEIVFTFNPTVGTPTTLIFSQKYSNWKSVVDFINEDGVAPSAYANAGDYFFSFLAGRMWLQDSNSVRNSFFGVNYELSVSFVSNTNPVTVKLFDSISLNSNKKLTSPSYGDISIPANGNQPLGMSSKLTDGQYSAQEGVFHAAFLRNAVTSSATPNIVDLINGDPLRGQYMLITIRNSDTSEVILHSVIINCTHSPLTK